MPAEEKATQIVLNQDIRKTRHRPAIQEMKKRRQM
jgi:hypothetical protein